MGFGGGFGGGVGGVSDHADLDGVTPGQHHTKTVSSEIDHAQVSNVSPAQHHSEEVPLVTALPAPTSGLQGLFRRKRSGAGDNTTLYSCVENTGNTFEWVQVAIST